jgi:hypothetical protein
LRLFIYGSITQKSDSGRFQLQLILDFGLRRAQPSRIWIAACDELPSACSGPELVEGSRIDCIKLEFKTQLPQLSLNPKSEI